MGKVGISKSWAQNFPPINMGEDVGIRGYVVDKSNLNPIF